MDHTLKDLEKEEALLVEILELAVSNPHSYKPLLTAAIRSHTQGYNVYEWVRIAEAIAKNHYELQKDKRVLSDKIILRIASELSEYYAETFKKLHNITVN